VRVSTANVLMDVVVVILELVLVSTANAMMRVPLQNQVTPRHDAHTVTNNYLFNNYIMIAQNQQSQKEIIL
jgi:hypothetical protein